MIWLAKFSIRRPKVALGGWLVIAIVLSLIGFGVSSALSPSVTVVRGTDSYRAQQLANQKFGPTQLMPILLQGPKAQLNSEGPKLVRALAKRPHTRVLSAWDAGTASAGLRPSATAAMILVSVDRSEQNAVRYDEPQISKLVATDITPPVRGYISGQPTIDRALLDQSTSTVKSAGLIAIGVLFLLLLVGLRAPFAALLVTIVAGATTLSAFGLMALLGKVTDVDSLALATGAIAGLTRGAGLSLVMLDRFHHDETDHPRALQGLVSDAVGTTGRALLYAGTLMLAALLLTDVLGPADVLTGLGVGALLCTALATGAAVVVVPAALVLFGPKVNRRLPVPPVLSRAWDRLVGFGDPVTRHAALIGGLAAVALLALAIPALAIKSGPQDVRQLPPGNQARVAFNQIARVMGAGWPAPYDVIVVSPSGPITTASMLARLNGLQTQIAHDPGVASVMGPGEISSTSAQLKSFGPQLKHSAKISDQSKTQLLTLIKGLGQAGTGSAQLQAGLRAASAGAGKLQGGSGQAQSGASQLHSGLDQARAGSSTLAAGLQQALSGAQALKTGAGHALVGATDLVQGIGLAHGPASQSLPALNSLSSAAAGASAALSGAPGSAQSATSDLNAAIATVDSMTVGKSDPQYAHVRSLLQSATGEVANLSGDIGHAASQALTAKTLASAIAYQAPGLLAALNMLRGGASQLQTGLSQLRTGNAQLVTGIDKLSGGGSQLSSGLGQLSAGAGALQTGLGQLTSGAGQLASGLTGGVAPAGQLVTGLGMMQAAVTKARGQIPSTKDLTQLEKQSPGLFNSGYFVLAAVAGAQPSARTAASFTINLLRGGSAGQIVVTGRYPLSDPRAQRLGDRLRAITAQFAKRNHVEIAVGGPAGSLFDVTRNANSKLLAAIIGTVLGVAVLLALLLRSVLIPAVAVACAALTTAATMGIMQLLFGGSTPALSGPGTFDPVSLIEILSAIFGATMAFLIVLLVRARDYFVAGNDARRSLRRAMRATIAANAGMAALVIGPVIPFAASGLQPVRRIAVSGGIAVAITAFVVVPVVLPATIALLGRFGWWPTTASTPPTPSAPSTPPGLPELAAPGYPEPRPARPAQPRQSIGAPQ